MIIIISLYIMRRGYLNTVDILEMWWRTWRGMGLTQFGGRSCLLYHQY